VCSGSVILLLNGRERREWTGGHYFFRAAAWIIIQTETSITTKLVRHFGGAARSDRRAPESDASHDSRWVPSFRWKQRKPRAANLCSAV
jgi:hypothetical protein